LWILAAIAMTGCQKMEPVEVDTGYRGKARINPFLAAWRLLESRDWIVEERHGLSLLPETDRVIVLSAENDRGALTAEDLAFWIEEGGHVVYLLSGTDRFDDELDKALPPAEPGPSERPAPRRRNENRKEPIPLHRPDIAATAPAEPSEDGTETDEEEELTYPLLDVLGLEVGPRTAPTRSCRFGRTRLVLEMPEGMGVEVPQTSPGLLRSEDRGPVGVISLPIGEGRITVLGDGRIWRNRQIGNADHAALFWELMRLHGRPTGAWFLSDTQISFFVLLWTHGWMAVTGMGIFVLCWLWRSVLRFGPLLPDPAPASRDFTGHLAQSGAFLWGRAGAASLAAPLRQSILQKLNRTTGIASGEVPVLSEIQLDELSRLSGLSRERIQQALSGPVPPQRRRFVELLCVLQKIDSICS
jgi:hypothetical protein